MDLGRSYNDYHHLNLARHPLLQMALLGRLHLVRRVTLRAQSCPGSFLRDCLDWVVWDSADLDWVLFVLHRTGNTDHLSCMHSVVHDAAARLSDLHERGDRKRNVWKTSLSTRPILNSDYDRDDLTLHIQFAPKNVTTQHREYQFA